MILRNIVNELNKISPLHLSEEWDNTGLIIESKKSQQVQKILLTIDITFDVLSEAIKEKYNLIITYHPLLFKPINRIDLSNSESLLLLQLIKNNISVYSPHTALDNTENGINDWLIRSSGEGKISNSLNHNNSVRIIKLNKPSSVDALAKNIKKYLNLNYLRIAKAKNNKIRTIACCAGSGYETLKNIKADCYLTGEMSHHNILSSMKKNITVILSEHTHTERGYLKLYKQMIRKKLQKNIIINISKKDKEPIILK